MVKGAIGDGCSVRMLFQGLWGLGAGGGAVDVLHRLGPGEHRPPIGNSDTYLSRGSMVKALMV